MIVVKNDEAPLGRDIGPILADGADKADMIVRPSIVDELFDLWIDGHSFLACRRRSLYDAKFPGRVTNYADSTTFSMIVASSSLERAASGNFSAGRI
jgi:hypothetical protein